MYTCLLACKLFLFRWIKCSAKGHSCFVGGSRVCEKISLYICCKCTYLYFVMLTLCVCHCEKLNAYVSIEYVVESSARSSLGNVCVRINGFNYKLWK